jgi:hypothetical protein
LFEGSTTIWVDRCGSESRRTQESLVAAGLGGEQYKWIELAKGNSSDAETFSLSVELVVGDGAVDEQEQAMPVADGRMRLIAGWAVEAVGRIRRGKS